jgi:hypothetical protein
MNFESITICSIYQYITTDELWINFNNYLNFNSDQVLFERYEIDKYSTGEPVGGFAESIIISIISSAIYEIGKKSIIELLQHLKYPIDRNKYLEGFPPKIAIEPGLPGNIEINFKFKDNKTVLINIPFPIESNEYIDKLDYRIIENQFLYNNTAVISFDEHNAKYIKGTLFDSYG